MVRDTASFGVCYLHFGTGSGLIFGGTQVFTSTPSWDPPNFLSSGWLAFCPCGIHTLGAGRYISISFFLTHGSLHHESMLIKKVQLDATVCRHLFTAKSLYVFRVSQHPSSGALKTVTATSGIGHNTGTTTSFQRGLIRPRWKEVAVSVLWPIPEVAVTVFSAPDDGCCDTRNM